MNLIFVFSLPRSGSTLLQRLLSLHRDVHTVSEPWILLPLLYTLKDGGVYTCYGHHWLRVAIEDLMRQIPEGRRDYVTAIRNFVLQLYAKATPEECRYFLDKTPRYHLIIDEIAEVFPDARFIFLWRQPLAIGDLMDVIISAP